MAIHITAPAQRSNTAVLFSPSPPLRAMMNGAMKFLHMSPIAVSLIGILYARNWGQICAYYQ
jgi:hypothetical protein